MGGLSAAIHAQINGFEVTVVEQQSHVGGKAAGSQESGYSLDLGPSIIILTRLYSDVFRRAGKQLNDYLRFERLDPFSRVYFQAEPFLDLPDGRDACLDVLRDHFPGDVASLQKLMKQLDKVMGSVDRSIFERPYDQPWKLLDWRLISMARFANPRRTYKQIVDQLFKHPMLRAFFYGFPSYGGQTYDSVAPGAFFIPYLMLTEGVYYPVGGVQAIPKAFRRLAENLGVKFLMDRKVEGLEVASERIKAVNTSSGMIACDAVISNVDRFTTGKWLSRVYDLKPSLSYFTVHWGINRRIPGLSHHTLLIPKDFETGFESLYRRSQFPDSPIVYINATHATDSEASPPGCSNIFAVVTAPAMEDHLDWKELASSGKERILRTLDLFDLGFTSAEIDFERVQSPQTFATRDGNYLGSLYGPDEKHRLFGMMPNRNWDEQISNLFYCGGSVQPGAGLPMVTLSGKFAAERLGKP